ncbi:1-acylglycerol-3-phosphate O [Trametopsis cervina]|nr:1-acylglycerol-3-phosphate O [Trametopsis cervina]
MSVFGLIKSLAYISLPVFALHTLSNASPVARYYVRVSLYLSSVGVASIWGVIVAVGLNLIGERFNVNWVVARTFYQVAGPLLGIKLVIEGEEHLVTSPAVYVGNHQSMLDLLYVGIAFPKRALMMGKKELQWVPFLGQFMTLSGAIFIDRGDNAKAVRSLRAAGRKLIDTNTSLWVFPEGTRSMREEPDMLPLKKGAFHLAVEAGVPIVPVVCENYWRLYRKGVFEPGTIKVKVLPPVPTTGLTAADVGDLAVRVREMMVEALREISVPVSSTSESQKAAPGPVPSQFSPPPTEQQEHLSRILPSVTDAGPDLTLSRSESRASTNFSEDISSPTSSRHGLEGSEAGAETEEDEGMVLVGRPHV